MARLGELEQPGRVTVGLRVQQFGQPAADEAAGDLLHDGVQAVELTCDTTAAGRMPRADYEYGLVGWMAERRPRCAGHTLVVPRDVREAHPGRVSRIVQLQHSSGGEVGTDLEQPGTESLVVACPPPGLRCAFGMLGGLAEDLVPVRELLGEPEECLKGG